ncbi:MAG: hypothetical protein L6R28_03810 [Planctomycetes bacterium]|nr:hypothetical protein [Planctomycetota bacterium]
MAVTLREQDRRLIEREVEGSAFSDLLGVIHKRAPAFKSFRTWADVVAFMRRGTSHDARKNDLLEAILTEYGADRDPRWSSILLLIFWPGLESIHARKRAWDADGEELWQNIVWTFLKILCRMDMEKRRHRLVQKIINDTAHHLHDEYRRRWRGSQGETLADLESLDGIAVEDDGLDDDRLDDLLQQDTEVRRFRWHLEGGRISDSDFHLLVGTRVYGKRVAQYAREHGLNYQAAKKRRQRAEASIRRYEEAK